MSNYKAARRGYEESRDSARLFSNIACGTSAVETTDFSEENLRGPAGSVALA